MALFCFSIYFEANAMPNDSRRWERAVAKMTAGTSEKTVPASGVAVC
jgi:hypothetical protein